MIRNLAIEGSGVKLIAHIGAYTKLMELGKIDGLQRVCGTSGGSIVASLVALKYTPSEMKLMVDMTDFKTFEDGNFFDKLNVVRDYGINPGTKFLEYIQDKIKAKTGNKYSTFQELAAWGYLDLTVFATDLDTQSIKKFCVKDTPTVKVCDAVRCSMGIPIFYDAYVIDGRLYVDGGVLENYPVKEYDCDGVNAETIGIAFIPSKTNDNLQKGQFGKYIEVLLGSVLNAQNVGLINSPEDLSRSILMDSCGVSATNFSLTPQDKMKLYESGMKAVDDYFKI